MAKFYEYDDFDLMTIHAGLLAGGIDAVWRGKREFLFVHSAGVMGYCDRRQNVYYYLSDIFGESERVIVERVCWSHCWDLGFVKGIFVVNTLS